MSDIPQHQTPLASNLKLFRQLSWDKIAVVLVDFQNDFCHENGKAAPGHTSHNAGTAKRANEFAAKAVSKGARIIYTQQIIDPAKLTEMQKHWEKSNGLCQLGSWGAKLFVKPVEGSAIITKNRFDIWRSQEFTDYLEKHDVQGLVIAGVELACCVLYAVMGADERGYQYVVPQDLVSGIDEGDDTYNKAIRDYLHFTHEAPATASELLA